MAKLARTYEENARINKAGYLYRSFSLNRIQNIMPTANKTTPMRPGQSDVFNPESIAN